MKTRFKTFRGTFKTFKTLFTEASDFATQIGPERLINVSHSEDQGKAVVTVWYWSRVPGQHEGEGQASEKPEGNI